MRAICPATVAVIMEILSQWECSAELRTVALKCCAMMIIVSQRSSPEEVNTNKLNLLCLQYF